MPELPTRRIDRDSRIPFYFQLKKLLEEEIASGRWLPGDRLPSEPLIGSHFALSRTTVRQALAELEGDGLILKERGRGTFIAETPSASWLLQSAHGFYDEAVRAGHTVRSVVLRCLLEPLPRWACEALMFPPETDGVTLERLRWIDDRLVMYVVNHLPADLAETVLSADLENGSLYRVLEKERRLTVVGGRRVVEAVRAQDEVAKMLDVEPGAPILYVESISWDDDARPFECYRAWHRADRTKIQVQVVHEDVATKAGFSPKTLRIAAR